MKEPATIDNTHLCLTCASSACSLARASRMASTSAASGTTEEASTSSPLPLLPLLPLLLEREAVGCEVAGVCMVLWTKDEINEDTLETKQEVSRLVVNIC